MRFLKIAGLAALLAAAPAFAQTPSPPPDAQAPAHGHKFDPAKFAAKLAQTEADLKLTESQKPLWASYVAVVNADIKQMRDYGAGRRGHPPLDLPARLDEEIAHDTLRLNGQQQEKQALTPLWASLTVDQRQVLDQAFARPHRDHRHPPKE